MNKLTSRFILSNNSIQIYEISDKKANRIFITLFADLWRTSASPRSRNPIGADWSGLERTGADIGTAPAGGDAIFAPASEEKSAMQGWNTLVVQPPIGEDGELAEPEAPDAPPARPQLPALPAKAELRDAEVHAMLGELDFGEGAVMGDATAEERQAIANFDIRAFA